MVDTKKGEIVTEDMVKGWLKSKDDFLIGLAEGYIGEEIPSPHEISGILGFLCSFFVGYAKYGLEDLKKIYKYRVDMFVMGVVRMGYKGGWYLVDKWSRDRGVLDKIVLGGVSHMRLYDIEVKE